MRRGGRGGRGCFYAYTSTPSEIRPDVSIATQIGRQLATGRQAMKLVEVSGLPGSVEYWSESTQQRSLWARRGKDLQWRSLNVFTGEWELVAGVAS